MQLGTPTPFPSQGGLQGQSYLNNHGSMQGRLSVALPCALPCTNDWDAACA